jgi:hypothetical protein
LENGYERKEEMEDDSEAFDLSSKKNGVFFLKLEKNTGHTEFFRKEIRSSVFGISTTHPSETVR